MVRPPELVIFDCDGVLVDSEILANRVLAEALSAEGYPVSVADCRARFVGRSIPSIVDDVERALGRALPADFEARLWERDRAIFAEHLQAVPGVAAALDAIPARRCVASSGRLEKMRFTLTTTGLIDRFQPHLFSAEMVARGKPAPDLFLYAAARMGVAPVLSAVVEDSVPGVRAAVAAGMRAVGFVGAGHAGPGLADALAAAGAACVIGAMADLPAALGYGVSSGPTSPGPKSPSPKSPSPVSRG